MLTLSLLRHAKSSWDDPDLDDFDRPLAKRGTKDAARMAAFMAAEDLRPDVVLCSSALRTRATLTLVLAGLGEPAPHIAYDDALYQAPPAVILARARTIDAPAKHALIVAHNPGLHALALELIVGGKRKMISALATKFPTAALAVLSVPVDSWKDVGPAEATLVLFKTPKSGL